METKRVLINKEREQILKKEDVETPDFRQKPSSIGNAVANKDYTMRLYIYKGKQFPVRLYVRMK